MSNIIWTYRVPVARRINKMEACKSHVFSSSLEARRKSRLTVSLLFLFVACRLPLAYSDAQLSPDKCLVFGPGIDPDRAGFPVNYFYIQAVDTEGRKWAMAYTADQRKKNEFSFWNFVQQHVNLFLFHKLVAAPCCLHKHLFMKVCPLANCVKNF